MENVLENKLSMYQKVQGFFGLHTVETAAIAAVGALKTQLETKLNAILALAAPASADITGFTVDKQAKRDDLKAKTLKLSTGLVAYAAVNDNFKLLEKCDETPAKLDTMRDNDFYTYAKLIINEATPLMTQLVPYGVTAADLTSANTSANTYLSNIQNPRVQINERSRSLADIADLFADMDNFLNNKLDKVMTIYIATNPSLYRGYVGARGIDQTRGNIAPDYVGTAVANEISLIVALPNLASRTFEIENTGTVALTLSLSATPDTMEGSVLTLTPGQYAQRKTDRFNTNNTADKLYVHNEDPNIEGSYKVWVVE